MINGIVYNVYVYTMCVCAHNCMVLFEYVCIFVCESWYVSGSVFYVCVCVRVCVCVHVCMCVCVCACVCWYACVLMCILYDWMCVFVILGACVYVCVCKCVHLFVCLYLCVCV